MIITKERVGPLEQATALIKVLTKSYSNVDFELDVTSSHITVVGTFKFYDEIKAGKK